MGLKYSQGKYGTFRYGISEAGFQFKVQISDSAGVIQTLLNNQITDLSWEFNRIGGCGKFSMGLKRQYGDLTNLTHRYQKEMFDVRIFITSQFAGSSVLYYRGFIDSIRPRLDDPESVIVSGKGYGDLLDRIQVHDGTGAPKEYTSTTLNQVVEDLINDFVTPNTPITTGTVDTFDIPIESIKFNGSVQEALEKLADIVNAEWGVDSAREFYFLEQSVDVAWRFKMKRDIEKLEDEYSYEDIVNSVIVEGGQVDGVPFRYIKDEQWSIDAYGLRQIRVRNSSIVESMLADEFAKSILSKAADRIRNIRIVLPFNKELIEADLPLGFIVVVDDPKLVTTKYAQKKYGTFKYCGETKHRVESIFYELRDISMRTELELNEGKPDVLDKFKVLEFELEQQRQSEGV